MYNTIFFILFKFSKLNFIHNRISAVHVIIAYYITEEIMLKQLAALASL